MMNESKPIRAYRVRITYRDPAVIGGVSTMFYAALTATEEEALASVRAAHPTADTLDVIDRFSEESTRVLGLAVGQASPL